MIKLVQKFAKYYKSHSKDCPKTFKILPKWKNFSKSGHTESMILLLYLHFRIFFCSADLVNLCPYVVFSVTRRQDCFSIFGHLQQYQLYPVA